MKEDELRDLVIAHDKHIDIMAQSIDHLAGAVTSTTSKLDDVIAVITQQNVLMEKFHNLESNLKESFARVHKKTAALEGAINWVVKIIIGAFISGAIGTLFILARVS